MSSNCFIEASRARQLCVTNEEEILKKYASELMEISHKIEAAAKEGRYSLYINLAELQIPTFPDYQGFIKFIQKRGYSTNMYYSDGLPKKLAISWSD